MTKEDLRCFAMYGLSELFNKSFHRYQDSNFTDEKMLQLVKHYDKLWNELYEEQVKEAKENALKSL